MTRVRLAAIVLATVSVGWLDPHAKAREAARLYDEGKYEEAVAKYNEALTDEPDSALLHFNLGDATYRHGKYTDALNAFQQVPASDADPARSARVAYNMGNAKYRLGAEAEASDPKTALGHWAEALVAYRRAMGAAPGDEDAKFNHEFVEKKMDELRKKLEEQQKEQEQQQQEPQDQPQDRPEDRPQEGEQKPEEQKQEEQAHQPEQPKEEEQKQPEQQQAAPQQPPPGGAEPQKGEMTKQEAAALLDSQRDQEVQPEEVAKRLLGGVVAEPAQDW
jgi:Ca-activated chloride channel family protein